MYQGADDTVRALAEYYPRTPQKALQEIERYLSGVDPVSKDRLYSELIKVVPPGHMVGLKDVYDACMQLNIHRPAVKQEIYSVSVECPACGTRYRWGQGVGDHYAAQGIYETCPECAFPYYEKLAFDESLPNEHYKRWYQSLVDEYFMVPKRKEITEPRRLKWARSQG